MTKETKKEEKKEVKKAVKNACPNCDGTGLSGADECSNCKGKGTVLIVCHLKKNMV